MTFAFIIMFLAHATAPDPRFVSGELIGKTPDQVIGCVGPPLTDRRFSRADPWTPQTDATVGPLVFEYRDERFGSFIMDYHYGVNFRGGKVDHVYVGTGH